MLKRARAAWRQLCPGDIDGFLFPCNGADANEAAIGLYPIVTLEKQLPNMIGNLV